MYTCGFSLTFDLPTYDDSTFKKTQTTAYLWNEITIPFIPTIGLVVAKGSWSSERISLVRYIVDEARFACKCEPIDFATDIETREGWVHTLSLLHVHGWSVNIINNPTLLKEVLDMAEIKKKSL